MSPDTNQDYPFGNMPWKLDWRHKEPFYQKQWPRKDTTAIIADYNSWPWTQTVNLIHQLL